MAIAFTNYIHIKDNYCCFYLGNAAEYVVLLKLLRSQIEEQLPGLNFYIGCRDEFAYLLTDVGKTILLSQLHNRKGEFAYIRELANHANYHAIQKFMEESDLDIKPLSTSTSKEKGLCLICPEGMFPTQPLTETQVISLTDLAKQEGYIPMILGSDVNYSLNIKLRPSGDKKMEYINEAKWVIGVENEYLVLAAYSGVRTTLVPTGRGEVLYRKMFPSISVHI